MALSIASKSAATSTTSTPLTLTKPTGLAAGDLMVAFVMQDNLTSHATRTGWVEVGFEDIATVDTGVNGALTCLMKTADADDAAAANFAFTVTDHALGFIYRITRTVTSTWAPTQTVIDNLTEIDVDTLTSGTNDSVITFTGGVTPVNASSLMLMTLGHGLASDAFDTYSIATNNPTWTEEFDVTLDTGTSQFISIAAASAVRTETTATGNYTFDLTSTNTTGAAFGFIGMLISISEFVDAAVTLDVVSLTATPQDIASVTGGASVTLDVVSLTATPQEPTITVSAAKWVNTDKSSAGSITNTDKS